MVSQGLRKFHKVAKFNFHSFARLARFRKVAKFSFFSLEGLQTFYKFAKFILHSLALCPAACTPLGRFVSMRNCWMLDSFSDSLPCILDCFGKGFKALQNLDSSWAWAFILICHGLYNFFLILMIKKNYQKHLKLAKKWLVHLQRSLMCQLG